ncbi:MAG: hypothetical protein HY216_11915 [Candidatus Rokubacteria bacterium]|nr:hypothetical protein [Candidatus Rokubacteria bacterium]
MDQSQVTQRRYNDTGRKLELPLTLIALLCAAITPNVFVAGGAGVASMSTLTKYLLAPAIVIQVAILLYARAAGYPRLFNRLVIGLWVGAVATTGLDIIRQPGTFFGYLAHDEARMAGEMILMTEAHGHGRGDATPEGKQAAHGNAVTDQHAGGNTHAGAKDAHAESKEHAPDATSAHPASSEMHATPAHGDAAQHGGVTAADFVGYAYHYWNGASLAVVYALVFGRTPWWGPLLYSVLFVDTGMMVFMRIAMGPLTWGIGLVALLAHVVFGLILGVLLARFIRDDGSILKLISTPTLRRA